MARILLLVGLLTLFAAAAPAQSMGGTCPPISFLAYGDDVFRGYFIPAGVDLSVGERLGSGFADVPTGEDACGREQLDVEVSAFAGIDPRVAVAVADRPALAFVLGNKCVGYVGPERWSCLQTPLDLDGRLYVGAAYPRFPAPRQTLPLGAPVGTATLGEDEVTAVRIRGVDPSVAVGIEGRPSEAFVAIGACQYERFDNAVSLDDLRRCLMAPVWIIFVPPGAKPGDAVDARADRSLSAGQRIAISLAPIAAPSDILPRDLTQAVAIGTLQPGDGATFRFEVPDGLESGRYEAVATCEPCGTRLGGRTVFPAGTFVVTSGDSSSAVIVVALVLALIVLAVTAVVVRRKGWIGGADRRTGLSDR